MKNWLLGASVQFECAMQETLRMLKEKPVNRMSTEPPPPVWEQRKTDAPAAPATTGGRQQRRQ